jgi:hypothetical protein
VKDPVVLICSGIIFVGFLGLVWAVAKFRRLMKLMPAARNPADEPLSATPDLRGFDLGIRPPAVAHAPTVTKDVADRLDSMTQRLAEMQAVLVKQSSAAPADAGGAVGQGFSPETIDKLLKIIGNVVQQVDILQKNLNPSKETPPRP